MIFVEETIKEAVEIWQNQ